MLRPDFIPWAKASDGFLVAPGETLINASLRLGLFNIGDIQSANKTISGTSGQPRPINVTNAPEIVPDLVGMIVSNMDRLGYKVFRDDTKNYNLNIVGLRSGNTIPNTFDDKLCVFWRWENRWTIRQYQITTDPGLSYLSDPMNRYGTAILKEGQYVGSHRLGKHKGKYDALVQAAPVTVVRDFDRDAQLDFTSGKEQTGLFGINIHRSSATGESQFVNKWSAGCQVFARAHEYSEFMKLCKSAVAEWGNRFSYTLMRTDVLAGV